MSTRLPLRAAAPQITTRLRAHLVHHAPLRPGSDYRRTPTRPQQRHGGTRLDEVGRVPGVKRSGTGGVARQCDKFPGKEMIP